ncbi:hypothetical protein CcCBS67573_g04937 [Chytriomyces confervae]|uniref:Chitin-binding type-4 domain-containing protein n=1 Tax=Chytriomyces confervae TaxID=246404 RepID=A0A507FES6_9FUNG|nr:hypothetical protein CcCBS67573_g04937 [Chytriomyces confervae]
MYPSLAILLLMALSTTTHLANAHGIMAFPIIRMLPQDQQNGYTYAKGATNVNLPPHPNFDKLCNYLPPGPVFTQTLKGGPLIVDWTISAFHRGGCTVSISRDQQKSWEIIGSNATCGIPTTPGMKGTGQIPVTLPQGNYSAVLRWSYVADNGGQPENEAFSSCADIVVNDSGSNKHVFYDVLPTSAGASDSALPKTPWQYFDSSCKPGAFQCSSKSVFINQCISLAASGTYNGGSGWYQYACPFNTTCQGTGPNAYCK